MITDEILAIIADPIDDGSRANALADEFRRGRPTDELCDALGFGDAAVVGMGCWILSEIAFERYNTQSTIIKMLKDLLAHTDAGVRFTAFLAVFPILKDDDESASIVRRAMEDENPGIRRAGQAAAHRLGMRFI